MKHSGFKIRSRSFELKIHERGDEGFERIIFTHLEPETLLLVFIDFTDPIDTRDGCHDDDVSSREERFGRCMSESVYFFVNRSFFFDIGSGLYDKCFWLIIVIVGDEIVDRIFWKKFLEFLRELGCEGFIVSEDEGWALTSRDDIGHRKSFP